MRKIIIICTIAILATSCSPKTSGTVAPIVKEEAVLPTVELKQGKSIYDSKCSQCHAPMVIKNYTQEQWNRILPDMSIRANLIAKDAALVQAYIVWGLNN